MEKWVICNDQQIPFEDKPVVAAVTKFIVEEFKPRGIILNGDTADVYNLSKYVKDPGERAKGLAREVRSVGQYLDGLRGIPEKYYLGGNHEDRTRTFMWSKAPELEGFLSFDNLFGLKKYGFEWRPYGYIYMLGKLAVTHGNIVRAYSGWSARKNFIDYGSSIITGHSHRMGTYHHTNVFGHHAAWENGHLSDPTRMDYLKGKRPNWQQGFSVVHIGKGGWFHVTPIPIIDRKMFMYGDQVFKVKGGK